MEDELGLAKLKFDQALETIKHAQRSLGEFEKVAHNLLDVMQKLNILQPGAGTYAAMKEALEKDMKAAQCYCKKMGQELEKLRNRCLMAEALLTDLQKRLAEIDLHTRPSAGGGWVEFLVIKFDDLKVKMYQEKGHQLPHLHIDYGKRHHVAAYSIQDGVIIEGNLARKYDKVVQSWILENEEALLKLWNIAQDGGHRDVILGELKGGDA